MATCKGAVGSNCMLHAYNFLRAAQRACLLVLRGLKWFSYGWGCSNQASFVLRHRWRLHGYPCNLHILLAMYSEAAAYMCTAVSSDQLIPLHHHAHLLYPACL